MQHSQWQSGKKRNKKERHYSHLLKFTPALAEEEKLLFFGSSLLCTWTKARAQRVVTLVASLVFISYVRIDTLLFASISCKVAGNISGETRVELEVHREVDLHGGHRRARHGHERRHQFL